MRGMQKLVFWRDVPRLREALSYRPRMAVKPMSFVWLHSWPIVSFLPRIAD